MKREERRAVIVKIVRKQKVRNVIELRDALINEGFSVSTATLSRDLQALRIVKEVDPKGSGRIFVQSPIDVNPQAELNTKIRDEVTDVMTNEFLVVIKTVPYWTDSISDLIDRADFPEVMSTLAGYDSIWIMTKSTEDAKRFSDRVRNLMK